MSLLEQASLIVTPNAYKENVLYSVVPNDRSGDLDVVRATTATRVNADGLIEVVPKNLASYSEQFDNAIWSKSNTTVTTNSITAPNGTLTADTITESTANAIHFIAQSVTSYTSGIIITVSFYAKPNGRTSVAIMEGNNIGGNSKVVFNLANGTVTSKGSLAITATILKDDATNWCYCTMSFVSISTNSFYPMIWPTYLDQDSYVGDGVSGFYLWGFQATQSSIPKDYFPTTDRLNIPRLDYSGGGCPSILIEPQRTNLALWSEDFSNASWSKLNTTVTANSTTSPDGTLGADSLIENTSTSVHLITQSSGGSGVNTYSYSVFAKNLSGNRYLQLWIGNTITGAIYSRFDLVNGAITQDTTLSGTGYSVGVSSIKDYGNGWYRCTIVGTKTNTTGTNTIAVRLSQISTGIETNSYLGDGTSGIYIWGAQLEAGSYPTSYIPTVASSVTRNADVISKTGISSLIGQTEGTLFVEFSVEELEPSLAYLMVSNLTDGTASNRMGFARAPSGGIHVYVVTGNTSQFTFNTTQTTGNFKLALAYKANDFKVYLNGVNVHTNTSALVPISMSRFDLNNINGNYPSKNKVAQALLFKTRLSNAELAQLTTI